MTETYDFILNADSFAKKATPTQSQGRVLAIPDLALSIL